MAGRSTGQDAVGWRVQVHWTSEDAWFDGVVTEFSPDEGYYICYDDGDEQWQPLADVDSIRFISNTIAASVEARVAIIPPSHKEINEQNGQAAVGWRVRVFWPDDDKWYDGVIQAYSEENGYFICYDDGEERWQVQHNKSVMEFVSREDAEGRNNSTATESPSKNDYGDDDFEDHEDTEENAHAGQVNINLDEAISEQTERKMSPSPVEDTKDFQVDATVPTALKIDPNDEETTSNDASTLVDKAKRSTTKKSTSSRNASKRVCNYIPPTSTVAKQKRIAFFHDKETLLEMKKALEAKRATLTEELKSLTLKVTLEEHTAKILKQTIMDLSAKLTVAQLKHSKPTRTKKPSTDEMILEMTVKNRHEAQENIKLKVMRDEAKKRVETLHKQIAAATFEWTSLPEQFRLTLPDMQAQITQLMQQKATLEAERSNQTATESSSETSSKVAQLKSQLAASDSKIWELKAERHHWKSLLEQERAKIEHLTARSEALQFQIARFRSSKALLRAAFDRCDTDKSGALTVDETIQVLLMLASPEQTLSEAGIRSFFGRTDTNNDQRIEFGEFCQAFDRLIAS
ncbi:unnamed protein product [Aphanomyces euteiches]|uniref:EF-hand domain-containing protein n=1 Tax=Aphanomyces euteiches TaxID=100861 RepID=A0A6G0WJU1_9STRA|nr:hypothetical protein Ae201684_014362 [Aphanomyces euteiches]KAH9088872.1 hypothetical protein Ae201684P_013085 [Aphanomyces euteiches]